MSPQFAPEWTKTLPASAPPMSLLKAPIRMSGTASPSMSWPPAIDQPKPLKASGVVKGCSTLPSLPEKTTTTTPGVRGVGDDVVRDVVPIEVAAVAKGTPMRELGGPVKVNTFDWAAAMAASTTAENTAETARRMG